jgi:hypothetical protein
VPLYLRVPPELAEQLKAIAAREDRPANTQAIRFLREGLERYEKDHPDSK